MSKSLLKLMARDYNLFYYYYKMTFIPIHTCNNICSDTERFHLINQNTGKIHQMICLCGIPNISTGWEIEINHNVIHTSKICLIASVRFYVDRNKIPVWIEISLRRKITDVMEEHLRTSIYVPDVLCIYRRARACARVWFKFSKCLLL